MADPKKDVPPAPSADEVARKAAEIIAANEAARNPQPGPAVEAALRNASLPAMSASEKLKGEKTTTMVFPRNVVLTLRDHTRIAFVAGINEVPNSLVDHMWLKQNGAKVYTGAMRAAADADDEGQVATLEAAAKAARAALEAKKKPAAA